MTAIVSVVVAVNTSDSDSGSEHSDSGSGSEHSDMAVALVVSTLSVGVPVAVPVPAVSDNAWRFGRRESFQYVCCRYSSPKAPSLAECSNASATIRDCQMANHVIHRAPKPTNSNNSMEIATLLASCPACVFFKLGICPNKTAPEGQSLALTISIVNSEASAL